MEDRTVGEARGLSRRDLIKRGALVAGGALAVPGVAGARITVNERADAANTLKIGFISPRTGALAGFGEPDPYVISLARKAFAAGITAGGTKYAVQILDRDTQSDPARSGQLAKSLINGSKIDLMLTTSTPEVVNPVADACEAAGVPCISTDDAMGGVVLRSRREARKASSVQVHVPLLLRSGGVLTRPTPTCGRRCPRTRRSA